MRLSTSTNILYERWDGAAVDQETSIRLCAEAGFQVLDFCFHDSVTSKSLFVQDAWKTYLLTMKQTASECGVEFSLGHALVYDFCREDLNQAYYDTMLERCILGAELLGIKWLVVHPSTAEEDQGRMVKDDSRNKNISFFKKWGSYAAHHHVGLAIENMWHASLDLSAMYATQAEELADLIDGIGLENVMACWDFEHGSIMGLDHEKSVKTLGQKLKAVHISDQTHCDNIHILPYQGVTDWDQVLKALAVCGYQGEFNYEIQWYLKRVPETLFLPSLRYAVEIGHYMIDRMKELRDGKKKA